MSDASVDLSRYGRDQKGSWSPGRSRLVQWAWWFLGAPLLSSNLLQPFHLRHFVLRLFGAQIGSGVVIKPGVIVKFPWKLKLGNHVWLGENVWIDNLAPVVMENHVCLSQGAYLLTGSHNYKRKHFDLITKGIHLESGVWIGAKSIVGPGVRCGSHSVLALGSVATRDLKPFTIYQGNPAKKKRSRHIARSPQVI